jgi:hypothetical protein
MRPDPVAQLVEQLTFNQWVAGSNPAGITMQDNAAQDSTRRYQQLAVSRLIAALLRH